MLMLCAPAIHAEKSTSMEFHYGSEPYTMMYIEKQVIGYTDYGFVYFDEDMANKFAGNKVTDIKIYNGYYYDGVDHTMDVYLTENVESEPYFKTSKDIESSSLYEWAISKSTLTDPYVIKANTGFYVGFSVAKTEETSSAYYPYAVDYEYTDVQNAFLTAHIPSTSELKGSDLISRTNDGGCLGIYITLEGDNLPQCDVSVSGFSMDEYVLVNEDFQVNLTFRNNGAQPVKSLDVAYSLNGGKQQTKTIDLASSPVNSCGLGVATFTARGSESKVSSLACEITKVNGSDDETPDNNTITGSNIICTSKYPRKVYCDEFTGTWCGYCPRGYVAMETMRDTYPDNWIGVAIHSGDEMSAPSSETYDILSNVSGVPCSFINRDFNTNYGAVLSYMEPAYNELVKVDVPASVKVDATYDETNIYVSSESGFGFNADADMFSLEYIVKEDNVGPYTQTNSYYAGSGLTLEWWSTQGYYVHDIYYNDVLRSRKVYDDAFNVAITDKSVIKHSATIAIPSGVNCENVQVVALVINNASGAVVNAAVTTVVKADAAQVIDISNVDVNEADAEYFTLQGVKIVGEPAPGLYIKRVGKNVGKVIVR